MSNRTNLRKILSENLQDSFNLDNLAHFKEKISFFRWHSALIGFVLFACRINSCLALNYRQTNVLFCFLIVSPFRSLYVRRRSRLKRMHVRNLMRCQHVAVKSWQVFVHVVWLPLRNHSSNWPNWKWNMPNRNTNICDNLSLLCVKLPKTTKTFWKNEKDMQTHTHARAHIHEATTPGYTATNGQSRLLLCVCACDFVFKSSLFFVSIWFGSLQICRARIVKRIECMFFFSSVFFDMKNCMYIVVLYLYERTDSKNNTFILL